MEQRFVFNTNYSVSTEVELPPAGGRVVAFGREGTNPNIGLDGGPLCMISPAGHEPWMGNFRSELQSPGVVNGIFSTPSPEIVCVVAGGFGYWVDVFRQTKSDIKCFPIRQVQIIEVPNLLVFADDTRLAAYDADGLKWRTDRLALDELFIVDRTNAFLTCEGLDDVANATIRFKVDLSSGLRQE